ncbi:hypothetical protein BV25DRAFT_1048648 [Artomyces pyxidatus]|uniref:Uncharacterized protein n=1 Tax=Artomyces pyxidatus TaxID=48021 RepID=A0ACB8SU75_9AGAM|nr:hypothetical protein BV25DRAFT_1048648 [Artomyces pyxidatus]
MYGTFRAFKLHATAKFVLPRSTILLLRRPPQQNTPVKDGTAQPFFSNVNYSPARRPMPCPFVIAIAFIPASSIAIAQPSSGSLTSQLLFRSNNGSQHRSLLGADPGTAVSCSVLRCVACGVACPARRLDSCPHPQVHSRETLHAAGDSCFSISGGELEITGEVP